MRAGSRGRWLFALLAIALVLGCRKKAGDPCQGDASFCGDPKTALRCDRGGLVAFSCNGSRGCVSKDDRVACDVGGNAPNEPCSLALSEGFFCASDPKRAAFCSESGKVTLVECAEKGCYEANGRTLCDPWPKVEGGKCSPETALPCTDDKKELWACLNGVWRFVEHCHGPEGCQLAPEGRLICDTSVGREGERCQPADRCDESKSRWLLCLDNKLVAAKHCRCDAEWLRKACDAFIADKSDACAKEGVRACSPDEQAIMVCQRMKRGPPVLMFEEDARCAAGEHCAPSKSGVSCTK